MWERWEAAGRPAVGTGSHLRPSRLHSWGKGGSGCGGGCNGLGTGLHQGVGAGGFGGFGGAGGLVGGGGGAGDVGGGERMARPQSTTSKIERPYSVARTLMKIRTPAVVGAAGSGVVCQPSVVSVTG